jgi:hypothetical protein
MIIHGQPIDQCLTLSKWPIEVIRSGIRLGISIPTITYMVACECYHKNNWGNWSSWVSLKRSKLIIVGSQNVIVSYLLMWDKTTFHKDAALLGMGKKNPSQHELPSTCIYLPSSRTKVHYLPTQFHSNHLHSLPIYLWYLPTHIGNYQCVCVRV